MRIRPQEPTAALAALITGNHGFLREPVAVTPWRPIGAAGPPPDSGRADELPDPPVQGGDSGRAFALVWSREEEVALAPEVFGFAGDERAAFRALEVLAKADAGEGVRLVETTFDDEGVPLVVVVARLETRLASLEPAWAHAESRVFDGIRRLLVEAVRVRAAVLAGRTRVVGALVEDADGRVHWLGELPGQERVLTAPSRG
ncbi:MAG: hypothetical protein RI967_2654 [Planctomycetota bacterium]|jgi:hypothetical protein